MEKGNSGADREENGQEADRQDGGSESGERGRLARRKFLKRSSGATAATFLAWQGWAQKSVAAVVPAGSVKRATLIPVDGTDDGGQVWATPVKIGGEGANTKWKTIQAAFSLKLKEKPAQPNCVPRIDVTLDVGSLVMYYEAVGAQPPALKAGAGWDFKDIAFPADLRATAVVVPGPFATLTLDPAPPAPAAGEPVCTWNEWWIPRADMPGGDAVGVEAQPTLSWKGFTVTIPAGTKYFTMATYVNCENEGNDIPPFPPPPPDAT